MKRIIFMDIAIMAIFASSCKKTNDEITIKSGIYLANYDYTQNKYVAIVFDIK